MSSQNDCEGAGKVVCVTGGSGYIGSWLVNLLLQRGYQVNATVRDPNDEKKTGHLRALDGAEERLHLFKADLLEEGSFNAAIAECIGVFHTASPVPSNLGPVDPQAELIDPALKGTLNVLKSCANVSSIKRVILTSSVAAVAYTRQPLTPDVVVDETVGYKYPNQVHHTQQSTETWFTDPEVATEKKLWYPLSKTLAEKAAWKFAKENNIDLIAMNPVFVIGPLLQPTLNGSAEVILKLVNGAKTHPELHFKSVDVRDVALAHILAFEIPSASGRYILIERGEYISEVAKVLHQLYPTLSLPEEFYEIDTVYVDYGISQEKSKTLGMNFIPLEVSLKDTIESLKEKGFLSI